MIKCYVKLCLIDDAKKHTFSNRLTVEVCQANFIKRAYVNKNNINVCGSLLKCVNDARGIRENF